MSFRLKLKVYVLWPRVRLRFRVYGFGRRFTVQVERLRLKLIEFQTEILSDDCNLRCDVRLVKHNTRNETSNQKLNAPEKPCPYRKAPSPQPQGGRRLLLHAVEVRFSESGSSMQAKSF